MSVPPSSSCAGASRGLGLLAMTTIGPLRRIVMREGVLPRLGAPGEDVTGGSLGEGSGDELKEREAAVLTFAATGSGLALFGIGAAFWGLVVGFAAETNDVVANATSKRQRKNADWIVANDVRPVTGIMGGAENAVVLVTADGAELRDC